MIEAIRSALENDGLETVTARLADIQNGTLDLVAFIKVHAPDVIVYDLPRPYENHWNFLRLMKETTSLKDRTWVLTTTEQAGAGGRGGSLRRRRDHRRTAVRRRRCRRGGACRARDPSSREESGVTYADFRIAGL